MRRLFPYPHHAPVSNKKEDLMQITCLGASRCVTGSSFLLDNGSRYLVDCGLFQGGKQMEALNHKEWPFDPRDLSAVFLTHAHIDHCGRLPKLVKDGFKGKIFATLPTAELCKILLLDSAHIQEMDAEWMTRKNRREGEGDVAPLYTVDDATACFPLFEPVEKDRPISINNNLKVSFRIAGHILGASSLEMWSGTPPKSYKVVFSGDIGYRSQLIVQDPEWISTADTLFVESTYGNRNHKSFEESRKELLAAIRFSYDHHEKVIIPAFAVERTQELLYVIGGFFREKLIPRMPVYVDSPLAIAATDIFRRMKDFYDDQTRAILDSGHDPFDFPELILTRSSQESMAINQVTGPAIVIAGNGMCTAGRIKHHLKHNIWRSGCSVVIVGFQAEGTLGRRLVEGAEFVKILGERVAVKAKIFTIGGFSAHADQSHLLEWIGHIKRPGMQVYVIHGEQRVSEQFAETLKTRFGLSAHVPAIGDVISQDTIESAVPAAEKVEADRQPIAGVLQKAAQIGTLLEKPPEALPQKTLRQIQFDLAEMANRLDDMLREIRAKTAPDQIPVEHSGPK